MIPWCPTSFSSLYGAQLFFCLVAIGLSHDMPAQPATRDTDNTLVPLNRFVSARRFAVGMTRAEVRAAAGAPAAMLDANVWVYWDFHVYGISMDRSYDTMLVVFAGERVKFFKLCARAPVLAYLARQPAS